MVHTIKRSIVRRGFLVLLSLLFTATGCGSLMPALTQPQPPVSTCQPQDEAAFSTWRGLLPGRSQEGEIVRLLGVPDNVTPYWDDVSDPDVISAYHYYPRAGRRSFYTVAVHDGVVQSTAEVSWAGSLTNTLYAGLVAAGCEPVILGQMISSNPVHAYPELGVAFEVGEGGAVLVERHFAPRSREEYLASWEGLDLRLDPVLNYAHALERLGFQPGVTSQAEVEQRLQPWTAIDGARTGSVESKESLSGLPEVVFYLGPDRTWREYPPKGVAWVSFREGVVLTAGFHAPLCPPCEDGHIPAYEKVAFGDFYTLGDALREYGEPALVFVTECADGMLQDLRLVYPQKGLQVAALADLCVTDYYCVLWNSSATDSLRFPPMSEEEFREQLRLIWDDEFGKDGEFTGCPYREVPWQDIARLLEQMGPGDCLQP
jgi:hypothetical protein